MKVHGTKHPGEFSVESVPGSKRTLIRLFQNIEPYHEGDFDGFRYDEYHVEVETWDGVTQNVRDNYEIFLEQGKRNEPGYFIERLKLGAIFQINEI